VSSEPWILHMSDPHLGDLSAGQVLDDEKDVFDAQPDLETTQRVFGRTLRGLRRFVGEHGQPDVAVVSGDLAYQAHPTGFTAFAELLANCKDVLPDDPARIVVVPGNHDVVWDEKPGTLARYQGFLDATRGKGCSTPLLDGIDFNASTGVLRLMARKHPHIVDTDRLFVVPLNSSNYCGVLAGPKKAMTEKEWEADLAPLDADVRSKLLDQIRSLRRRDAARVSRWQIEALGHYFDKLRLPRQREPGDDRLRVAVIHHQLLPVSTREERKLFESLTNLGQVRQTLREYGFDIVLHGHKHEAAIYWDVVGEGGPNGPQRRILVISSPGHFDVGTPVMRAIFLEGSRSARNVRVFTFTGSGAQRSNARHDNGELIALWTGLDGISARDQTLIAGATAHATYSRLRALFELRDGARLQALVCRVEDPSDAQTLPPDYPHLAADDPQEWLRDLVTWWQRERSELVARDLAPFNHGERIYRRWGDQVGRAIRMLNERGTSSRALVQLIHPRETGRYEQDTRDLNRGSYPSFALVEFSLAERNGERFLDCFGYFRVQELQYWWPVNLAELARIQERVRAGVDGSPRVGRIVTFSGNAVWDTALPGVAVPVVDLLVEDPGRLWEMASAVAYPDAATDQATLDWRDVLRDLSGAGRHNPPLASAGIEILADHTHRLRRVVTAPKFRKVDRAVEDLRIQYEALADAEPLRPAAVKLILSKVETLTEAVAKMLPEARP